VHLNEELLVILIATSTLLNVVQKLQILERLQVLKHCQVPLTSFVLSRKSFGRVFPILSQSRDHKAPVYCTSRNFPLPRSEHEFDVISIIHSVCLHSTCKHKSLGIFTSCRLFRNVSSILGFTVAMKRHGVYCANIASPFFQPV
jgi:hypothetical protein